MIDPIEVEELLEIKTQYVENGINTNPINIINTNDTYVGMLSIDKSPK